jgi:hypothetical protein
MGFKKILFWVGGIFSVLIGRWFLNSSAFNFWTSCGPPTEDPARPRPTSERGSYFLLFRPCQAASQSVLPPNVGHGQTVRPGARQLGAFVASI